VAVQVIQLFDFGKGAHFGHGDEFLLDFEVVEAEGQGVEEQAHFLHDGRQDEHVVLEVRHTLLDLVQDRQTQEAAQDPLVTFTLTARSVLR